MQFIKNLGKVLGIILGIMLLSMFLGWLVGAEPGEDRTEYYLYEHEVADDFNERNNAPWYNDSTEKTQ